MSVVLDAGPILNFLAVGQQNVIIQAAKQVGANICVPEVVDREVRGMASSDRFDRTAVAGTWSILTQSRIQVLSDPMGDVDLESDAKDVFRRAVARISGIPAEDRVRDKRSLGEIVLMAHASAYAQRGETVYILMDDRDARAKLRSEQSWLKKNGAPGTITLWRTASLLSRGNNEGWLTGSATWEAVYEKMTEFDDGLWKLDRLRQREKERAERAAVEDTATSATD